MHDSTESTPMIFFILIALSILIPVLVAWLNSDDSPVANAIVAFIVSLIFGGIVMFGVAGISSMATDNDYMVSHVDSQKYDLQALNTGDSGNYYLGSSSSDSSRSLNYIYEKPNKGNPYSVVSSADGDGSRVFQDITKSSDKKPYVEERNLYKTIWWVAPFEIESGTVYDFHVPKNSVIENYKLDNK